MKLGEVIKNVDIYIKKDGLETRIEAVQADSSRYVKFNIIDYNIPDGAEARFFAKKPSGMEVYNSSRSNPEKVMIEGNVVKVNLTSQTLAEVGVILGEIQLIFQDKLVSSFVFPIDVKKSIASETAIESRNEYGILDNLLHGARSRLDEINTIWTELKEEVEEATIKANDVANQAESGEFTGTITIGEVEAGDPGADVEISNSGTLQHAVLNFKIPRGLQGEKGDKGDRGESGVTTPVSGFFSMYVDSNGNLYACSGAGEATPEFEYDRNTGNLYFITEV